MEKLTAAKVKSITKPGVHGNGRKLYLAVAKGGSKSWVQRITIDGKFRDLDLGVCAAGRIRKVEERETIG